MNILTNVIKKKEVFNIACIDKNELVLTYSTSKKCLNTQIWNTENLKPKDVGNRYEKNYTWKNEYKPGLESNNCATYNAKRYPVNNEKRYTAQDRLMKYRKTEEPQIVQELNKFKQPENRQQYKTNDTRYSAQNTSVLSNNFFNMNISQSKNNLSTQPFKILPGIINTSTQENNTLINNLNNFNRKPLKKLTEIIETSEDLEKTKENRTLRYENSNNKNSATRTRPNDIKKHLWDKRYLLFSKFDEGIMMDNESFYSVCLHIASRCPGLHVAMDPFCSAGSNVIQMAKRYKQVIAVDNDANKLEFAKRNAEICGVMEKITFVLGHFFKIAETLKKYKPQVKVTSPPWGGPSYKKHEVYSLEKHMCSNYEGGGKKLFGLLRSIAPNVALHIPKTTGRNELIQFGKLFDLNMEIQHNYIDDRHDSITAFFGRFFNMNTKFLSNNNKLYTNKNHLKYS